MNSASHASSTPRKDMNHQSIEALVGELDQLCKQVREAKVKITVKKRVSK